MSILDTPSAVKSLAAFSKALFGNQDRLLVGLAIASAGEYFYGRELAQRLQIADPRVNIQLAAFERAGLIRKHPHRPGDRRMFYSRVQSTFWEHCHSLAEERVESGPPAQDDSVAKTA